MLLGCILLFDGALIALGNVSTPESRPFNPRSPRRARLAATPRAPRPPRPHTRWEEDGREQERGARASSGRNVLVCSPQLLVGRRSSSSPAFPLSSAHGKPFTSSPGKTNYEGVSRCSLCEGREGGGWGATRCCMTRLVPGSGDADERARLRGEHVHEGCGEGCGWEGRGGDQSRARRTKDGGANTHLPDLLVQPSASSPASSSSSSSTPSSA